MEEEYELIPMGPLRKIERRMEKMEKTGATTETIKELVDIVRSNQKVIDDIVKINSDMTTRISTLLDAVSSLNNKMNDFIERIEMVSETGSEEGESKEEEEKEKELEKKFNARIEKLEKRVNSLLLSITKAKTRRPQQNYHRYAPV